MPRPPVWLMRQAGRFDPLYQQIRKTCGLELEDLFRNPVLAAEITCLPLRLGVDAAILFQDILTPLVPFGFDLQFRPGPQLSWHGRTERAQPEDWIDAIEPYDVREHLGFVPDSIHRTLQHIAEWQLPFLAETPKQHVPLLGFAGAPLTLAGFLLAGESPGGDVSATRRLMQQDPERLHKLLTVLADVTAEYLSMQLEAGVMAVQLFESLACDFTRDEYEQFALPYQQRVFRGTGVPHVHNTIAHVRDDRATILFARQFEHLDLLAASGANVLSVSEKVDLHAARQHAIVQGNVNNTILRDGTPDDVRRAVRACLEHAPKTGHIFNLSHGLLPGTPFDNVVGFIDEAKK